MCPTVKPGRVDICVKPLSCVVSGQMTCKTQFC